MTHGWKTRIEERRYFEEKKKAQLEAAYDRLKILRRMMAEEEYSKVKEMHNNWSAFA